MIIPERFTNNINTHLLGNYLGIDHYPLIMAICGRPGVGKTYQLRNYLHALGISIFSVSAAELESYQAGRPAKLIQAQYKAASDQMMIGKPAALLIDDIDTTLGEWENNTGTVNHQNILAFLMHIADHPTFIDGIGEVRRIPVFFTGNDNTRLYDPLMRAGRVTLFIWEPKRDEKADILKSLYKLDSLDIANSLIDLYPHESIAFFSSLLSSRKVELLSDLSQNVMFSYVISNDDYRKTLLKQFNTLSEKKIVESIISEAKATRT